MANALIVEEGMEKEAKPHAEGDGGEANAAAADEEPAADVAEVVDGEVAGAGGEVTAESLVIPEGRTYDDELGGAFLGLLNDEELDRGELAQKLVDLYAGQQDKFLESVAAARAAEDEKILAEMRKAEAEWAAAAKRDQEYGGDAFETNVRYINAGRDRLATPGAREVLESYGLGAHPEIVRMFYRAGRLLAEDGVSGKGGGERAARMDPAEALFGEVTKNLKI